MTYINNLISDFILFITHETALFWENLSLFNFSWPQVIIDIILVSIVFYYIFVLLKGSRAVHILVGLSFLAFIFLLSRMLELFATGWLLDRFLTVILVAIPVIFQQELRRGLEKLGQTRIFSSKAQASGILISNIVEATVNMAENKVGSLIVLKNYVNLNEYAETGIPMDSKISKELLQNIFYPKSPLHDGAIIIENARIKAAACVLPHSFKATDRQLGTRHKAAMGLSENTDAEVIVVSEERGTISYSKNGNLDRNIEPQKLQRYLENLYFKPVKAKKKKQKARK